MKILPPGSEIIISTEKNKLNLDLVIDFISHSYWAKGRSREAIETGIKNSICFGIYLNSNQIGFARVLSDFTTIAYLMDVFIIEAFRGYGLGQKFINEIISYKDFRSVKKWLLSTKDAHSLYKEFGFAPVQKPEYMMEMFPQTE